MEGFGEIGIAAVDFGSFHILVAFVTVPKHDDFRIDAALFATGDVGVTEFVGMMIGKNAFKSGRNGSRIRLRGFGKVYVRKQREYHGSERDFPFDDVAAEKFFAGLHLQPGVVQNGHRGKFGLTETEIQKNQDSVGGLGVGMREAKANEFLFFVFGESGTLGGFIIGQDDFLHGRGETEVFGSHIENAGQLKFEFFRGAEFLLCDEREEIILEHGPGDFVQGELAESGKEIAVKKSGIFLESRGFGGLFFDFQPIFAVITERDLGRERSGIGRFFGRRLSVIGVDEFLFHGIEIGGGDFNMITAFEKAGLIHAAVESVTDDLIVVNEVFLERLRKHG